MHERLRLMRENFVVSVNASSDSGNLEVAVYLGVSL